MLTNKIDNLFLNKNVIVKADIKEDIKEDI